MINSGFEIRNATMDDIDQIIEITTKAFNNYKELSGTKCSLPALDETREKVAKDIENKLVLLIDPMLATGGSACDAIQLLKDRGCQNIKFMAIIGAPEGVTRVAETHPDVKIYVSTVDRCLNEHGYILPGLGDAGDRLFGTK